MRIVNNIIQVCIISATLLMTSCTSNTTQEVRFAPPQAFYVADSLRSINDLANSKHIIDSIRMSDMQDASLYADILDSWYYCYTYSEDSSLACTTRARKVLEERMTSQTDEIAKQLALMELVTGFCSIQEQPDSGIHILNRAINRFKLQKDVKRIINTELYLSEIYKNREDFVNSLKHLSNIQDIFDTITTTDYNPSWILSILSDVANMQNDIGDFHQSSTTLHTAALYYDRADYQTQAYYLYQRTKSHFYQQEYTMAAYSASRLETLAEEHGFRNELAWGYTIHGLAHARMEDMDGAYQMYAKADSVFKNYSVRPTKEILLLEGEIAAMNNELERARFLLFDSTRTDSRTFAYRSLLESQKAYHKAINDYKSIYKLQLRQNIFTDSLQSRVISHNEDYRLENSRLSIKNIREKLSQTKQELDNLKDSRNEERFAFLIILIMTASVVILHIKNEDKRQKLRLAKEQQRLENEIADKIQELRHQKEMLQVTNNRMTESITYAEHIQHSIIPRPDALNNYDITGSFIFYSPLDIVSGDFYWFTQKGDHLIVCCADCTGHGVPGAFMSMIASTILNDICNKNDEDIMPSQILEMLDTAIIETLGQNNTEDGTAHDGCDISIASINTKTKMVTISSAKRPVIVIRDQEIIQVNGTKRSIGDTEPVIRQRAFTDTSIQLHTNDDIYMFSDGYSDQFGGKDGNKMKSNKIKSFLRVIHDDDMDEQGLTMQDFFTQWKGDYPQTDDVLFIGIKL